MLIAIYKGVKSKSTTDRNPREAKPVMPAIERLRAEGGQVLLLSTEKMEDAMFARIGNGLFFATKKPTRKTSLPATPRVRFA